MSLVAGFGQGLQIGNLSDAESVGLDGAEKIPGTRRTLLIVAAVAVSLLADINVAFGRRAVRIVGRDAKEVRPPLRFLPEM